MTDLKRVPYARIPRTAAHAGLESRQLVQLLSTGNPGDLFTYVEMQELIGVDVQVRRDLLETALRIVQQTYGKVFAPEIGIGIVCLSEPEKVGYAESKTQRIARASQKNLKMMATVQMEELSDIEKRRFEAQMTVMAAVNMYTHEKTIAGIEAGQGPPLPVPFDREAHKRLAQMWAPQ